jgi:hypothetical protein
MRHHLFPPGRLATLAALTVFLLGGGAASGEGPAKQGEAMREPASATEPSTLPKIDRNPPSGLETATFAMG